jgi:hypothetical protein
LSIMGYLQAISRPDIAFSISQCARFACAPRQSHELTLIRMGQNLKKTADKGLIRFRPTLIASDDVFKTNVYVDTDFASGWG